MAQIRHNVTCDTPDGCVSHGRRGAAHAVCGAPHLHARLSRQLPHPTRPPGERTRTRARLRV